MEFKEQRADHVVQAGHKPPQVTIPARVFAGSKNNFARGRQAQRALHPAWVQPDRVQ
jgi:hypothetical protein